MTPAEAIPRFGPWSGSDKTLFASPCWFEEWMNVFGRDRSGLWITNPGPSGTAVAFVRRTFRFGPLGIHAAVGASNAYSPQFDLVGGVQPSAPDFVRMMNELGVAVVILPSLSRDAAVVRGCDPEYRPLRCFMDDCGEAPVVDTSGSWDAYLAGRGSERASAWRYYERRATKSGSAFSVLSSWSEIAAIYDEMLDVEASGWKGREGTAVKLVPEARTFYQRVSPRLADAGKLRVFLNRRDGRILAFKLCALHGGRLSSLKIGYLDAYAKESPGQVLRYWTIRWAFAQPDVSMFDMLAPASEDKLRFATDVERLHTLYLFHPGVKGTAAWLRWSLVPRLRARWRRQRERGTRASS